MVQFRTKTGKLVSFTPKGKRKSKAKKGRVKKKKRRISQAERNRLREMRKKYGLGEFKR